jgi:hypothetical protein
VSDDWRFAIAYNAALQATTAALAAAGYRASRENHHYRVIQSLELTLGKDAKFIRAIDAFRKKRNVSSYDIGGGISHREVRDGVAQDTPSCKATRKPGSFRVVLSQQCRPDDA